MVEDTFRYEVDPDGKFKAAVRDAAAKVDDLTIPFISITRDWYQGNKAIFALKSPGKYVDYKKNKKGVSQYAKRKQNVLGSPYPMLRGFSQNLENSLTNASNSNAINQVINRKSLILGTRVTYGPYLQLGTKFMVPRPFLFIGAEQTLPQALQQRRNNWIAILQKYVKDVTGKIGTLNG